jgi:hypothetical protein
LSRSATAKTPSDLHPNCDLTPSPLFPRIYPNKFRSHSTDFRRAMSLYIVSNLAAPLSPITKGRTWPILTCAPLCLPTLHGSCCNHASEMQIPDLHETRHGHAPSSFGTFVCRYICNEELPGGITTRQRLYIQHSAVGQAGPVTFPSIGSLNQRPSRRVVWLYH